VADQIAGATAGARAAQDAQAGLAPRTAGFLRGSGGGWERIVRWTRISRTIGRCAGCCRHWKKARTWPWVALRARGGTQNGTGAPAHSRAGSTRAWPGCWGSRSDAVKAWKPDPAGIDMGQSTPATGSRSRYYRPCARIPGARSAILFVDRAWPFQSRARSSSRPDPGLAPSLSRCPRSLSSSATDASACRENTGERRERRAGKCAAVEAESHQTVLLGSG